MQATKAYVEIEKKIAENEPIHAVLVSANSIKNLRKAYPSYFLDTGEFIKYLSKISRAYSKL